VVERHVPQVVLRGEHVAFVQILWRKQKNLFRLFYCLSSWPIVVG
jgi:hypothetical protein